MNWLDELVHQHSELESPVSFWRWSALAALSAVLKDSIYLDRAGLYRLYPNIYVMLHADSGLKKGPPVSMAKQLVKLVNNTTIISGRSSIQGIMQKMGTSQTMPGGTIKRQSTVFICSSELTSSIVEDKAALEILTDLYDRNYNIDDWESILKMGNIALNKPTVTMLTATNEAHAEEFFIKKDVQGGYIARTFIIYEKKRNKVNSLMYKMEHPPDYKKSAEYLKEIAKLHGEIIISEAGMKFYDEWYHEFVATVDNSGMNDSTGTLNRFGDSVLKVAILLALSDRPELTIEEIHLSRAVLLCEKLIGNMRKTTMGRGKSVFAQHKALLINELIERDNHSITRQMINKKFGLWATSNEWDEILRDLAVADILKIELQGTNTIVFMTDERARELKRHLDGK